MRLAKKTAPITGGNSGIDRATARLFHAEGAQVAITGRNTKRWLGAGVLAIRVDVTDVKATKRAAATIFDVVFANAGIGKQSPLDQTALADFKEIVRTNLTAVFFTVQAALPHLKDGASIILKR
jgi:NAD(P)-dependent dehydrogenase (short-subunit alcohol dehydrogenase family)